MLIVRFYLHVTDLLFIGGSACSEKMDTDERNKENEQNNINHSL